MYLINFLERSLRSVVCVLFPLGVLLLDVTGQDILAVNSVLTGGKRSPRFFCSSRRFLEVSVV